MSRCPLPDFDPPQVLERFHSELGLVDIIARQLSRTLRSWFDFDDLRSAGREGLLEAARRFEPTRQVTFKDYANFRVRGAMLDFVRKTGPLPRHVVERAAALRGAGLVGEGYSEYAPSVQGDGDAEQSLIDRAGTMATAAALGVIVADANADVEAIPATARNPEEAVARAELVAIVRGAIADLPEREAELVRLHTLEGQRIDDVAKTLGIDRSWAIRMHARAVDRLTKRLRLSV